jgi:hypothetical protein
VIGAHLNEGGGVELRRGMRKATRSCGHEQFRWRRLVGGGMPARRAATRAWQGSSTPRVEILKWRACKEAVASTDC